MDCLQTCCSSCLQGAYPWHKPIPDKKEWFSTKTKTVNGKNMSNQNSISTFLQMIKTFIIINWKFCLLRNSHIYIYYSSCQKKLFWWWALYSAFFLLSVLLLANLILCTFRIICNVVILLKLYEWRIKILMHDIQENW